MKLTEICNDLRLLASGPRCGLNEIHLLALLPGSSIMRGKVSPVIPEGVKQASLLAIGLDTTVTLATSAGQLQLNVMEPVIAFSLFLSINAMENAVESLRAHLRRPNHGQRGACARHGAQLAGHRHLAQADSRLRALRRNRARGLARQQAAAPDRRRAARAAHG